MKKWIALVLALAMCLSLAACGGSSDGLKAADMSKYPEKLENWNAQNVLSYFTEIGAFPKEEWRYTQDKANRFFGQPISESVGYMDMTDAGTAIVAIYWVDPLTEGDAGAKFMESVCTNKNLGVYMGEMPIDHVVGNFIFCYTLSVDPDYVDLMDEAYAQFLKDTGATAVF